MAMWGLVFVHSANIYWALSTCQVLCLVLRMPVNETGNASVFIRPTVWMHFDTTSDQDSEKGHNQQKGPEQGAGRTASRSGEALRLKEGSDMSRLRRWHQAGTRAGDWEALSSCSPLHFPSIVPSLVLNYVYACVQVCVWTSFSSPLTVRARMTTV